MTVDTVEQAPQSGEVTQYAQARHQVVPSSRLQQFAADGAAAYNMALSVAKSTFVPMSYRTKGRGQNKTYLPPEEVAYNITAAWLAGDEIGLKPMQALQAINIIEGTPALSAQAMRALVQSHGHEIWVEEQSGEAEGTNKIFATVAGRRAGSERIQRVTWSWQRARQAGLTEKENWRKDPLAMCIARGSSAVSRLIAADVLMGLAYSVEELADEDLVIEEPQQKPTATLQRAAARKAVEASKPGEGETPEQPQPSEPAPSEEEPERQGPPREEERDEQREQLDSDPVAQQQEQAACGEVKPDRSSTCSRPQGHDGRHYFGGPAPTDEAPREPERSAQPAQQQPQAGPEQLDEHGQEFIPDPDEEEPNLTAEDRQLADPVTGQQEEALFKDPTDEELEAAFLAEQEERQRAQRAADDGPSAASAAAPLRGVEDAQLPEPEGSAGGEDDDPWADFR